MDKNRDSKRIICLTLISLFALIISGGCVETPEASPAMVDQEELSRQGWEQLGDVKYETYTEEIPDLTNVTINTAIITYQDSRSAEEIAQQMWQLQKQYKIDNGLEMPFMGSQLVTVRLTLPAGIELPTDVASEIINYQIENTMSQNDVDEIMKTESGQITLDDGSVAVTSIYEGHMSGGRNSVNITGIAALWSGSHSNTIAIGIVPQGNVEIKVADVEETVLTIDSDKEINEILEMIRTIN